MVDTRSESCEHIGNDGQTAQRILSRLWSKCVLYVCSVDESSFAPSTAGKGEFDYVYNVNHKKGGSTFCDHNFGKSRSIFFL